jgi:hypothetical protein
VKLGTLHAILTGSKVDPKFMTDIMYSGGDEGPWVFDVPTELVKLIASLNAEQMRSVGEKWAATEEFSPDIDDWPPDAVHQALKDLVALCKRSTSEGKSVLMWMCL